MIHALTCGDHDPSIICGIMQATAQSTTAPPTAPTARPRGRKSVIGSLFAGEVTAALEGVRSGGPIIETTVQRAKRLAAEEAGTDAATTKVIQEAPTPPTPAVEKNQKSKPTPEGQALSWRGTSIASLASRASRFSSRFTSRDPAAERTSHASAMERSSLQSCDSGAERSGRESGHWDDADSGRLAKPDEAPAPSGRPAKPDEAPAPSGRPAKPDKAPAPEAAPQRPAGGSRRQGRSSVVGSLMSGRVTAALESVAAGTPLIETTAQRERHIAAEGERAEEEAQAEAIEKMFASATPQRNGEPEPPWRTSGSQEVQPTSPKKNGAAESAANGTAATPTPTWMQADPEALAAVLDADAAAELKPAVKDAGMSDPNCLVLGFRWIVTCGKP